MTNRSAICRLDNPSDTRAADGVHQCVDVADKRQMGPAGQDAQGSARDLGRQPSTLGQRYGAIVLAVDDEGLGSHPRQVVGDVDEVASSERPVRRLG